MAVTYWRSEAEQLQQREELENEVTMPYGVPERDDELPNAVKIGRLEPLKTYVRSGADVNAFDDENRTLLHHAVLTNTPETKACIAYLLKKGSDVNKGTTDTWDSPLHLLLLIGNVENAEEIALLLMTNGADVTLRNKKLRSPYDIALMNGFVRLAAIMHGEPAPELSLNHTPRTPRTPLTPRDTTRETQTTAPPPKIHVAVATEQDVSTPPEAAAVTGGEEVRIGSVEDESQVAEKAEKALVALEVRRAEEFAKDLVAAVIRGDLTEAHECLKKGANVNAINAHGAAPLHYAVSQSKGDKPRIVELLCDAGADVNLLDYEDDNALNLAIKTDRNKKDGCMYEMVNYLLQFGAKATFKDLDGKDAFTMAEERGYQDILELLRGGPGSYRTPQFKRSPTFQDNDVTPPGSPPPASPRRGTVSPRRAVSRLQMPGEQKETVFDHSKPDADGLYPIHLLVLNTKLSQEEKEGVLDTFEKDGADFNVQTVKGGDTALHLAVLGADVPLATKLLLCGAEPDAENEDALSPRMIAEEQGDDDMKKIFQEYDRQKGAKKNWQKASKKSKTCTVL